MTFNDKLLIDEKVKIVKKLVELIKLAFCSSNSITFDWKRKDKTILAIQVKIILNGKLRESVVKFIFTFKRAGKGSTSIFISAYDNQTQFAWKVEQFLNDPKSNSSFVAF